jgi:hypothetical protein
LSSISVMLTMEVEEEGFECSKTLKIRELETGKASRQ